ncbi:hypothetical protein PIB30_044041 [Stylosanthes scabra]|uniref:Uncharacterized protein n=1 Tax=Stylosanthes scabra TaxID=79078 RepID=A0ABU6RFS6_9FABA|nr:hypothetical protein [Stylosanthes scabra]
MRPPASRRGRRSTVRPFALDHFIPVVPSPRPTPLRPLPQRYVVFPIDGYLLRQHLSTGCNRETSIEMSQSQSFSSEASVRGSASATSSRRSFDNPMDQSDSSNSADSFDDLVSRYDAGKFTFEAAIGFSKPTMMFDSAIVSLGKDDSGSLIIDGPAIRPSKPSIQTENPLRENEKQPLQAEPEQQQKSPNTEVEGPATRESNKNPVEEEEQPELVNVLM